MAKRSWIGDYIENLPQRALWLATKPFSYETRGRMGAWCARRALLNVPSLRNRVLGNLENIYPEMDASERKALLVRIASNLGWTVSEILHAKDFLKETDRIHVSGDEGLQALLNAQKAGKPAIGVSGHFGPWEAIRTVFKQHGVTSGGIYRPMHNRFTNIDMLKNYEVFGTPMFPKGPSGTRGVVKHLRGGGMLSLVHDQKISDGVLLDFMGKPASTSTVIADLALKYKAPLVPAYAIRAPDKKSIEVVFEPPLEHTDSTTMAQQLNDSLAARIRENPDHWYWLHQRWKINSKAHRAELAARNTELS